MATANKLTYLNDTKSLLKTVINYADAGIDNNTTFRNYAVKLYDAYIEVLKNKYVLLDSMPKGEQTGTSISTTDAADLPVYSFKLTKESSQHTTTGKNKYNVNSLSKNNCTYIVENDSLYMTITGSYAYVEQKIDNLDITKQYTISVSSDSNNMAWMTVLNDNRTKFAESYSTKKHSFIPQTTTIYIRIYGSTSGTSGSRIFSEIQLEEGNARTDYEEYTGGLPAPNPSYPQEIITAKGYRNLFDKSNTNIISGFIQDSTGKIVQSGYSKCLYITCKPNTTYSVQKTLSARFAIATSINTPASNVEVSNIVVQYDTTKLTTTSGSEDNYLIVWYYKSDTDTLTEQEILNSIMIAEGTEELPYVPYGNNYIAVNVSDGNTTNSCPIPLNNNEIVGIGDYKDELLVDKTGHVYLNKKTKKIILDGTEDWVKTTNTINNTYRYYFNTINDETDMGLCNYFTLGVYADRATDGVEHIYINTTGIQLRTTISTTNNLKSWLQDNYQNNNPVLVYVPLATSQLIDLNTTIDIALFNGINNISNSEGGLMNIRYVLNNEI